jgi:hypothetical protein
MTQLMTTTVASPLRLVVGAVAALTLSYASAANAQDLNIINCNTAEVATITAAWGFLNGHMRSNAATRNTFINCIENAQLVDTESCDVQLNRSAIYLPITETDYNWRFECTNLDDANADGRVKIEGARMRFDVGFLGEQVNNAIRVAGVMGHELMHNRGFSHENVPPHLYKLTVPEQVEACIQNTIFGGASNEPDPDHWDRRACCEDPRHAFSDSRSTYEPFDSCIQTPSGTICLPLWTDAATGELIDGSNGHADAAMCVQEEGGI